MVWICTKCNGKNNNSSNKCRIKKCHEPKPESIINKEQSKKYIRDYCPVCKSHQDFNRIKGKQYACQKCHKRFKFKGKPVPEDPIIVKLLTEKIEESNLTFDSK